MSLRHSLGVLAALAAPACAAEYTLELKPENTRIEWTLGDPLHTVRGTFKLKNGRVDFDPESGKASGQVVVDVASGDSGGAARDNRMHANVLESAKYPEAAFAPDRVEGTLSVPGTSSLKFQGTFSIHGAAHPLTMSVQSTATADQIRATMAFDIPYVAWGMKDPSNLLLRVSKTVRVSIETSGTLKKN